MKEQRFRKLAVWHQSMDLVEQVYRATGAFPAPEVYGLTSQLRRAATSIALNIAEGSGADSDNEYNRFLAIALRSAYEVLCGLEIAKRLDYITDHDYERLLKNCDHLSAMLFCLKKKLKAASNRKP
jgi:four helix bundle protein